uniref:Uncharacterized protein n=1 Tax=Timema tahoe TaxID=61484 RepID=A0A7R9IK20_9NEOP|nr:unnamed protein product [Timema tahoe]
MPITEDVYDCHTQVQSTQHAMSKAEQRRHALVTSLSSADIDLVFLQQALVTSLSSAGIDLVFLQQALVTSLSSADIDLVFLQQALVTSLSSAAIDLVFLQQALVTSLSSADIDLVFLQQALVTSLSSADIDLVFLQQALVTSLSSADMYLQALVTSLSSADIDLVPLQQALVTSLSSAAIDLVFLQQTLVISLSSAGMDLVFLQQTLVISLSLFQSNKPIMEKRRRARINHCLNELKTLILDAMKKDPARHSKLEKADILEMTVKHLQTVQRQQLTVAMTTDPGVLHKFKTGFNECAGEVSRYISRMEGVEAEVKQRLIGHLANCVTGLQQLSPFSFGGGMGGALSAMAALQGGGPTLPLSPGDVNNNQHSSRLQGLHLIPSRLPTGELALLLPNSGQLPLFSSMAHAPTANNPNPSTTTPTNPAAVPATANAGFAPTSTVTSGSIDRSHPSAFTAVTKSHSPHEGPLRSPVPPQSSGYSSSSGDEDDEDYDDEGSLSSEPYHLPHSPPRQLAPGNPPYRYPQQTHAQPSTAFQPLKGPAVTFKMPLSGSSGFKPYQHQNENRLPPQQTPLTSSIRGGPQCAPKAPGEDSPRTFTTELRSVPTSFVHPSVQGAPVKTLKQSPCPSTSTPMHLPLSVITNHAPSPPGTYPPNRPHKDPLDFSVRRDDEVLPQPATAESPGHKRPGSNTGGCIILSSSSSSESSPSPTFLSPNKISRLSFSVVPEARAGEQLPMGGPLLRCTDNRRAKPTGEELSNKPSTSHISSSSTVNRDMWRPW